MVRRQLARRARRPEDGGELAAAAPLFFAWGSILPARAATWQLSLPPPRTCPKGLAGGGSGQGCQGGSDPPEGAPEDLLHAIGAVDSERDAVQGAQSRAARAHAEGRLAGSPAGARRGCLRVPQPRLPPCKQGLTHHPSGGAFYFIGPRRRVVPAPSTGAPPGARQPPECSFHTPCSAPSTRTSHARGPPPPDSPGADGALHPAQEHLAHATTATGSPVIHAPREPAARE